MERESHGNLITNSQGKTIEVPQTALLNHPDKKITTPTNNTWLTTAIETQRQRESTEVQQNEASVTIQTGLPYIGIFFTGDWHFGSDKVDYALWDKHQSLVINTPGLYEAVVGDERDNFVDPRFRSGLYEGIFNPEQQAIYIKEYMQELDKQDKIIARVGGNHDFWTWEGSGINFETFWQRDMKSPILRNGGFVHLKTNEVKYELYLHHGQSLFNSNFNPNHATRRAYEFQGEFDVGAMGHKHMSEVAHGWRGADSKQKDVLFLRTGTYKLADQYSRSRQMGGGQPPGATVLFNTQTRDMMGYAKIEDAVKVLGLLNN
jgi:predicted phosphodiesterase